MISLSTFAVAAWGVAAALTVAALGLAARNVTYAALPDARRLERRVPPFFRLLLPWAPNLRGLVSRRCFAAATQAYGRQLRMAGLEGALTGPEFMALRFLVPLVGGGAWALAVLALGMLLPSTPPATHAGFLVFLGVAWSALCPAIWLRQARKRRHGEIVRALPFVLDLLTLSVEAGMGFMNALVYNCERHPQDALNEEFLRTVREMQLGLPRRVALERMADRTGLPDLASVLRALVQAETMGVALAPILRLQSEQLRAQRFERAEKAANEAPVKMLGPLMLCIFPAVFLILLGPVLMRAASGIF